MLIETDHTKHLCRPTDPHKLFGGTFFELVMVENENLRIAFEISTLSIIVPDISISGLGGHIAISGCRSLSQSFWPNDLRQRLTTGNSNIIWGHSLMSL